MSRYQAVVAQIDNSLKTLSHRVTLKDVARQANVHVTTVSLALRGHPGISAPTRARISAIATGLGYQRDPVLMALTSRRTGVHLPRRTQRMAFLTNHPDRAAIYGAPHMRYFFEGARRQAEAMGYSCDLLFVSETHLSSSMLEARLHDAECEGIIIGAFNIPGETITLDWSRYAIVKIDSRFMEPAVVVVANDQMQAVRLAYGRLYELGYRRIGMAVGLYDEAATRDLYAAGCLIEQAGVPPAERIPPLHFAYEERVQDVLPNLRSWVREHGVQVVISNWSEILPMAMATGLRVPDELACVCLCLSDPDPLVAGVVQNHLAVGRQAAEVLALALKVGQRGISPCPPAVYIAGHWQNGASAPPVR
jgi:DNA-binding LacI/PurR family transcriptional regulator